MKTGLVAALAASTLMVAGAAQANQITFAHGANPGNPRYIAANDWAKDFTKCTGGKTTVEVAPSATMGDDVEMLTSTLGGVINVTANSQGPVSQIVPEVGLLGLPFLFKSLPDAWKVEDGPVGKMLDARAQKHGLKILGFWDNGLRDISTVDKLVPEPGDLKGVKIRTPPDPMTIAIFKALGAAPAPLAFSELPSALQSGVFDAQENPLINIYTSKIYQITKYITMTNHKYESTPVVTSLAWWNSQNKKTQACLISATKEAGKIERNLSLKANAEVEPKMKAAGVVFGKADHAAYVKATKPVYVEYAKKYPKIVAALQKAAGQ